MCLRGGQHSVEGMGKVRRRRRQAHTGYDRGRGGRLQLVLSQHAVALAHANYGASTSGCHPVGATSQRTLGRAGCTSPAARRRAAPAGSWVAAREAGGAQAGASRRCQGRRHSGWRRSMAGRHLSLAARTLCSGGSNHNQGAPWAGRKPSWRRRHLGKGGQQGRPWSEAAGSGPARQPPAAAAVAAAAAGAAHLSACRTPWRPLPRRPATRGAQWLLGRHAAMGGRGFGAKARLPPLHGCLASGRNGVRLITVLG